MIHATKDLSPDQKAVIEGLLGRRLRESEEISIHTIEAPAAQDQQRTEALQRLKAYFAQVDAQRQPVSQAEAEAALDEALRAARPSYVPIR